MSREGYYGEVIGSKLGLAAVDLSGGAETARIDLGKGDRATVILEVASFAADLDLTLMQHDAAAGGNSKVVAVTGNYYVKLAGASVWTKVELASGTSNLVLSQFDGAAGEVMVEVLSNDLDANGDYTHMSVVVADPGGARLGSARMELRQMRHLPAYAQEI